MIGILENNDNLVSLLSFIPELIILEGMISIILLEIIPNKRKYIYSSTLGVIVLSFIALLFSLINLQDSQLFMNLIVVDPFSNFFKIIFLLSTFIIVLVSESSVEIKDGIKAEYYFLLLVILLGMFLMASSINLLMVYLAIELVSIPS